MIVKPYNRPEDLQRRLAVLNSIININKTQLPPIDTKSHTLKSSSLGLCKNIERQSISQHDEKSIVTQVQQQLILVPLIKESIDHLIKAILQRGKKCTELFQTNNIKISSDPIEKYLRTSSCITIKTSNVLEKFYKKGRLGYDLKGLNKDIIDEIEMNIFYLIQHEYKMYQNQKHYNEAKQSLQKNVEKYSNYLKKQLQKIKSEGNDKKQ